MVLYGTKQTDYGDTQISQELWQDINISGFSKEIERVFKELRAKGYSTMVIRAAMVDELGVTLAEATVRDGMEHRKRIKNGQ